MITYPEPRGYDYHAQFKFPCKFDSDFGSSFRDSQLTETYHQAGVCSSPLECNR